MNLEPVMLRLVLVLALVALLAAGCGEKQQLQLPEDSLGGGDSIYFPDGFPSGSSIRIEVFGPGGCSFAVESVEVSGTGAATPDDSVATVQVARDFESSNPC